jgi:hypothetical protein
VANVRTSNQDRAISLKRLQCIVDDDDDDDDADNNNNNNNNNNNPK